MYHLPFNSQLSIVNYQLSKFDLSNNRAPLGLRIINYQLSIVNYLHAEGFGEGVLRFEAFGGVE